MKPPYSRLAALCVACLLLLTANQAVAQRQGAASSSPEPSGDGIALQTSRFTPDLQLDSAGEWGQSLNWRWREFSAANYWLLGVSTASAVTLQVVPPLPKHRRGGVWIDEDARDVLRPNSARDQLFARDTSDVLLTLNTAMPFFDSIVVAGWYRQSPEVGRQMALINFETMAVNAAVTSVVKFLTTRERPYGRHCGETLPESSDDCDANERYRSFMSGHASQSFVSAALVCSHHYHLELYGSDVSGALPCISGLVLAGATSTLRVVADRHYTTDVMVGAATGTSIGLLVPWLLHYNWEQMPGTSMTLVPGPGGFQLMGTF